MDLKVHRLIEKKMSECDLRHALSSSEIDWLLEQIQDVIEKIFLIFKIIKSDSLIKYIDTYDDVSTKKYKKLKRTADIIIKQATCDHRFALPCASICSAFQNINNRFTSNTNDENSDITFKEIIVHKCLVVINSTDWDQDAITEHNYLVAKSRFVCELLKHDILTSDILILCIQKLLSKYCEVHVEFVCNILTVLGKNLDQVHNISYIFYQLEEFVLKSEQFKVSKKLYSMIVDVINLKHNKWVWKNTSPFSSMDIATNSKPIEEFNNKNLNRYKQDDYGDDCTISPTIKTTNFNCNLKKKESITISRSTVKNKLDNILVSSKIKAMTCNDQNTKHINKNVKKQKCENIKNNVQSILNKITSRNKKVLLKQMKQVHVYNLNHLLSLVDVIVNQVFYNPVLIPVYVEVCVCMKKKKVPSLINHNKNKVIGWTIFPEVIADKCLDIFKMANIEIEGLTNNIHGNTEHANPKSLRINKIREKVLVNNKFVLELHKQNFITFNTIIDCLDILITKTHEEFLECACYIILAVGEKVNEMYEIVAKFNQLKRLISDEKILPSKNVQCMIKRISEKLKPYLI